MNINNFCELILKTKKDVVISTHQKPDGDAIGAQTALALILNSINKKVFLFNAEATPSSFLFLEDKRKQFYMKEADFLKSELDVILVDCHTSDKTEPEIKDFLQKTDNTNLYCIDHHKQEEINDKTNYILDDQASCTGELIYSIAKELDAEITKDIAECLYTSIISDTRSFKYSRTTPNAHRIASELLKTGIDNEKINANVFSNNTESQLRFTGWVLSNFELKKSNKIIITNVTNDIVKKFNLSINDIKGVTNNLLLLEKTEFAILMVAYSEGETHVIIKSKGNFALTPYICDKNFNGKIRKFGAEINIRDEKKLNELLDTISAILG